MTVNSEVGGASWPEFIRPDLNRHDWTPTKLVDFHLKHNPAYPVSILTNISTPINQLDNHVIRWDEAAKAILVQAQKFSEIWPEDPNVLPTNRTTIGILASAEPLSYFLTMLALMRLGFIPVAISPRNSPAAIAHLVQKCNCQRLLVEFDPATQSHPSEKLRRQQVQESLDLFSEGAKNICLEKMPTAFDLIPRLKTGETWKPSENSFDYQGYVDRFKSRCDLTSGTMWILHSSGTTKLPKLIPINQANFQGALNLHKFSNFPWKAQITTMMSLPPYHSMAFNVGFYPVLADGSISGLFLPYSAEDEPCQTPKINSLSVTTAMRKLSCTIGAFTPFTLMEFSKDPNTVAFLKQMKRVGFGGGPLRPEVGNYLVSQGVCLASLYGMTEAGCITKFFAETFRPEHWEYFEISPHITPKFIPHGENQYELAILSSENHCCSPVFENEEQSPEVFHTNDLLYKHPSLPLFRIVGRVDDQIMLSNSEKTNPAPLEDILCHHEAIEAAVMFGRGKPQNGVILEPSTGFEVDLGDHNAVERYLDLIWPSVQEMNRFAPTHSRLTRDLILVVDPRVEPLPRTAKGAVSRVKAVKTYEEEIEILYQKSEQGVDRLDDKLITDLEDVDGNLSEKKIIMAVKKIAERVFDHTLDESENLFKQGCDSLRCATIRSKICRILKLKSIEDADKVTLNIVYQEPSILKLASWLRKRLLAPLQDGNGAEFDKSELDCSLALQKMNHLIMKYTPRLPKIILITGTTGSLGSHVLVDLLKNREVDRVFALNRSSTHSRDSPLERHAKSFKKRGLDENILVDNRLTFLEADNLDDLSQAQNLELSNSVTHIIHLSYPVEFNFSIESFEDAIRFTSQLTQLFKNPLRSRATKPTFVFGSSVATIANYSGPPGEWVDEVEVDIESALGTGYGESKRVCETIVKETAEMYEFRSIILRIAQLCGSRSSGAWNQNEWFPLLVQSGVQLGCLPTGEDDVAWIPVDEAASTLNDFTFCERTAIDHDAVGPIYRNLVHPYPAAWQKIISRLAELMTNHRANRLDGKTSIELVSYSEWFGKLSEIAQGGIHDPGRFEEIPAIKLVEHFHNQMLLTHGGLHQMKPNGYEAMGVKRMETKLGKEESDHLRNCRPLSDADVDLWFNYWIQVGLIT